jgi:hypothetical protein
MKEAHEIVTRSQENRPTLYKLSELHRNTPMTGAPWRCRRCRSRSGTSRDLAPELYRHQQQLVDLEKRTSSAA